MTVLLAGIDLLFLSFCAQLVLWRILFPIARYAHFW